MNAFTANELTRLRSQPQSYRPRLAVFKPATSWSGALSGSHAKGARSLTVTTSSGAIGDILVNTTLLVGSDVNQHRMRVKSASGSTIVVGENSIDWADGDALEVLLYFEPHPIFNRIVSDGENISFFEDYDTQYTDENENFAPVVNIGPAVYALELDCGGAGTVDLTIDASTDSFVFDSSLSSYLWTFEEGAGSPGDVTIEGSDTSASVTYRFHTTGNYYISCTITAANGKSHTSYRPVIVSCDQDGLSGSPYYDFAVDSLEGSRDTGYWTASIVVYEDSSVSDFPRNVPVVVYGSATYGSGIGRLTDQVGWHYDNATEHRFVGYVREEAWTTTHINKGAGISLEAVGLCGLLDEINNYPVWLQYKTTPTNWSELMGLSVDRLLYFYLKQRSTLLLLTDWHPTNDTRLMNFAELPAGTMYSAMREFLSGTIFADMICDRHSALWCEVDGQLVQDADRSAVVTDLQILTNSDHLDEIIVPTTRDRPEITWISIDGLHFDGTTNAPIISYAPGYVINALGGGMETITGLVLESTQGDLNTLAGRLFVMRNNPYKEVRFETPGVYPYDIAPQASVKHTLNPSGTFREEQFTDADFIIRSVSDNFYSDSLGLNSEIGMEIVVRDKDAAVGPNIPLAVDGVEGIFPPDVVGIDPGDYGDLWNFDWDWPDYDSSTSKARTPQDAYDFMLQETLHANPKVVFVSDFTKKVYITYNFDNSSPTWQEITPDADLTEIILTNVGGYNYPEWADVQSPRIMGLDNDMNVFAITTRSSGNFHEISLIKDIFQRNGAMSVEVLGQWHQINEFALQNFAKSLDGNYLVIGYSAAFTTDNAGVVYSLNRGLTWGVKELVQDDTDQNQNIHPFIAKHQGNPSGVRIYQVISHIGGSAAPPTHEIYKTPDGGTTWQLLHNPAGMQDSERPFLLDVPQHNNPLDKILWAVGIGPGGVDDFLYRIEGNITIPISTTVGGDHHNPLSLRSHMQDSNYLVGTFENDGTGDLVVLRSSNKGSSWQDITPTGGGSIAASMAVFAWDSPDFIFVSGSDGGTPKFWYSVNGGSSYIDKTGDLSTQWVYMMTEPRI